MKLKLEEKENLYFFMTHMNKTVVNNKVQTLSEAAGFSLHRRLLRCTEFGVASPR